MTDPYVIHYMVESTSDGEHSRNSHNVRRLVRLLLDCRAISALAGILALWEAPRNISIMTFACELHDEPWYAGGCLMDVGWRQSSKG